jgi:hypothetical protein
LPSARRKAKKGRRASPSDKTLLTFLDRHLSRDFPNPDRKGCPSKELLELLAFDATRVQASVVRHLLRCSPCYRCYARLLDAVNQTAHRKRIARHRNVADEAAPPKKSFSASSQT